MARIRKRSAYTRARSKRSRPRTPAPKNGWLIAELGRLTGVPVRTLRHYVSLGLLRPMEFRGTETRYARREFLRLLRILRYKQQNRVFRLSAVKKLLEELSVSELEAWVAAQPLAPAVAAALGIQVQSAPAAPKSVTQPSFGRAGVAVETWRHVRLLPGLALMVSTDASPAVLSIAQKIYEECAGASAAAPTRLAGLTPDP